VNPTLAEWLEADETTREVFMDWLLERIPLGYRDQREADHSERVFPRFVHEETGVLFHVIFGGPAVMGMTPERWQRVLRAFREQHDEDEFFSIDLPTEKPDAVSPPREVMLETALVAERPLLFGQMRKLGIDESILPSQGIDARHLGTLLSKLPRMGWRAPSEAEWEYALRVFAGDLLDAGAAPDSLLSREHEGRLLFFGSRNELCCDNFESTLADYPSRGSRGNGYEVIRGDGPSVSWQSMWNEAIWPGRRALAEARGYISFRPWVSLLNR
jgi:hypothetical protein